MTCAGFLTNIDMSARVFILKASMLWFRCWVSFLSWAVWFLLYLFTACQLNRQVFALKAILPHWIQIREVCLFWRGHKWTGDLFWVSFGERCCVTSHRLSSRSKGDLSHTSHFCMDFLYTFAEVNLKSFIFNFLGSIFFNSQSLALPAKVSHISLVLCWINYLIWWL